jgi:hypothetical protein
LYSYLLFGKLTKGEIFMTRTKRWGIALPLFVLGAALAVLPQTLFPACPQHVAGAPSHGETHNATKTGHDTTTPCFFTARVVSGLGGVVGLGGLSIGILGAAAFGQGVSFMALLSALLALLTSHWLVGVCSIPTMTCRAGLAPAIDVLSGLIVLASLFNIAWLSRKEKGRSGGKTEDNLPVAGQESSVPPVL